MGEYNYDYSHIENKYSAANACEKCDGVIRHEPWCIRENAHVYYAFEIIEDPRALSNYDIGFLKAYKLDWATACQCP